MAPAKVDPALPTITVSMLGVTVWDGGSVAGSRVRKNVFVVAPTVAVTVNWVTVPACTTAGVTTTLIALPLESVRVEVFTSEQSPHKPPSCHVTATFGTGLPDASL